MDEREAVTWLHRRVGLGLAPDELEAARGRGIDAELDRLTRPSGATDPWTGVDVPTDPAPTPPQRVAVIAAWIDHLATTSTPLIDRLAWTLHGWLVSSMAKATSLAQMVNQIRLYRYLGAGRFPDLLRAVSTDPAMLAYLDGRDSTAGAPNENFSREVMELFALGVGNYTEADVKAGARALTGWTADPAGTTSVFHPERHDDTPQRYLDSTGVHDVDSVIAAIQNHPADPTFVATRVAREVLGTDDPDTVRSLTAAYEAGDRRLDAVVLSAARIGVDGEPAPVVLAPVPWLAIVRRATGVRTAAAKTVSALRTAGQLPLAPPNVAGWPRDTAWFSSSTVVARADLAAVVAHATAPDQPTLVAATAGDLDTLADLLGAPGGHFGTATTAALEGAATPHLRLALALTSPEVVIA